MKIGSLKSVKFVSPFVNVDTPWYSCKIFVILIMRCNFFFFKLGGQCETSISHNMLTSYRASPFQPGLVWSSFRTTLQMHGCILVEWVRSFHFKPSKRVYLYWTISIRLYLKLSLVFQPFWRILAVYKESCFWKERRFFPNLESKNQDAYFGFKVYM